MDDFDLSQFRDLFIDESQQYIQALNANLLALERDPDDAGSVQAMFHAAHSLKGNSATMGYDALARLAHAMEDLLQKLRSGRWQPTPPVIDLLFGAIDVSESLLADAAAERAPTIDLDAVLERLHRYEPKGSASGTPEPEPFHAEIAQSDHPEAVASAPEQKATSLYAEEHAPGEIGQSTMIRIDVRHLDALLNIVTEMIIHRSLLNRVSRRYSLQTLNEVLVTHSRTLNRLRDSVLEMRMTPVSQVFDRFPRMVRDLLQAQNKQATLIISGADVEMDRTALEALNEPLVHLLRNAIDHGLESPDERISAGKPAAGTLRLAAQHHRNSVIIELSDDGKGIDCQQIATVAMERGLVAPEAVAEMSQEQLLMLICHPEFSLRKEVSTISGRGVGMSVVKQQVERLRGSLRIETQVGRGSTFRLKLPIKLSLVDAMLLRVGSEQYAVPMSDVEQIVEIDPAKIELVGDQEVISVNGTVVPLCRLSEELHSPEPTPEPRYALLVRRGGQLVGLRVDAVEGHEEIVVKPLPFDLRRLPGLSGFTILGEGQPTLIVDMAS